MPEPRKRRVSHPRSGPAWLALALSLSSGGCIQKVLTDGQIEGTRKASAALDSTADYELARSALSAGIAQFEGMHALAPYNTDALVLLVKSWASYGFAFVEDELESAEDAGDDDLAQYDKKRARDAYDRSIYYGLQLLSQKAPGFDGAKRFAPALSMWLSNFTSKDEAVGLLWTGQAWLARVGVMRGDDEEGGAFVAEAWVGAAMLERAVAIEPAQEHDAGLVALAAYHARTPMAELDEAKRGFDLALARTKGKTLLVPFNYAVRYACMRGDGALYRAMLGKVLQANDPDVAQRLSNAIAKGRARRWLGKRRMKDQCGFDPTTVGSGG